MTGYAHVGGELSPAPASGGAIWIDLLAPDEAERRRLAAILGFEAPTREEQEEIELSSRLYMENGAAVMTALLPAQTENEQAEIGPVTFILTETRLVTIRHHDPRPFTSYPAHAARATIPCDSALGVLLGLLEEVIDRLADITEYAGRKIETLTDNVFRPDAASNADLKGYIQRIGRRDKLVAHIRDSLVTVERLLGFLTHLLAQRKADKKATAMVKSQLRDVKTISEQANFLMQKTAFLLDATMGLINIEQNAITRMFSIVAVIFLPPTLIASIYGMNFQFMPELGLRFGYPGALLLMVGSVAAALAYCRRRGWL